MGKYYAREVRNDCFDYEMYFDEYEAKELKMWIGGNRNFISLNDDLYDNIVIALEDIYYVIDEAENDTDRRKTVECYLKPIERTDAFTDLEISKIIKCAEEYDTSKNDNEVTVASALSIVYGKKFTTGTFRGCCQGDWLKYICPKEIADNKKSMDFIEAVLFSTGTEFEITETKLYSADDFEHADSSNYYTAEWRDDCIKADLAEQIGCSVDELAILKVKGEHHYVTYDYEEI